MARTPKILPKDIRDAIREMSKHPTGMPRKVKGRSPQQLSATEKAEVTKRKPVIKTTVPPKVIAKKRSETAQQRKENLKNLKKTPPKKSVRQPIVLSKKIPTRQELEANLRAVKYKGKTLYLTPAQIKKIAKGAGIKVDFPKGSEVNLFKELPKGIFERETGLSPEARAAKDRIAAKDADTARKVAEAEWQRQLALHKRNPQKYRHPNAKLIDPTSATAEARARKLLEEELRRRASAAKPKGNVGRIGGIPGVGFGSGLEQIR